MFLAEGEGGGEDARLDLYTQTTSIIGRHVPIMATVIRSIVMAMTTIVTVVCIRVSYNTL